ncbi:DNA-directed RNA polymerase II core subunit rpo21 [Hypoxylon texense]
MSSATQNIGEHVRKSQPQTFLSLAPTTSASYPTAESIKPALHPRRSSSASSSSSSQTSLRFLKLGPVHFGEHPDEHKEDYHEVFID